MGQKRKMPSKRQIIDYWYNNRLEELELDVKYWIGDLYTDFDPKGGGDNGDTCMACGEIACTERAHIVRRQQSMNDDCENIHLLCSYCHKEMESLEFNSYSDYKIWFSSKNSKNSGLRQASYARLVFIFNKAVDFVKNGYPLRYEDKVYKIIIDEIIKLRCESMTDESIIKMFQAQRDFLVKTNFGAC